MSLHGINGMAWNWINGRNASVKDQKSMQNSRALGNGKLDSWQLFFRLDMEKDLKSFKYFIFLVHWVLLFTLIFLIPSWSLICPKDPFYGWITMLSTYYLPSFKTWEQKCIGEPLFVKDAFHICFSCSTDIYFPWHFSVFTNRKQIGFQLVWQENRFLVKKNMTFLLF